MLIFQLLLDFSYSILLTGIIHWPPLPKFSRYVEVEAHYIFHPSTICVRPLCTELGPKNPPKMPILPWRKRILCRLSGDITSPARRAQLLHLSLAFCFSLQPTTAYRPGLDGICKFVSSLAGWLVCWYCCCVLIAVNTAVWRRSVHCEHFLVNLI